MEVSTGSSELENAQTDVQIIRITTHGKMKPWITFALNVFEVCPRSSLSEASNTYTLVRRTTNLWFCILFPPRLLQRRLHP
jgi:hypothetical protein